MLGILLSITNLNCAKDIVINKFFIMVLLLLRLLIFFLNFTMADDDARLGIGTGNAYVCVRTMRAAIKQCIMILRCLSPGAI